MNNEPVAWFYFGMGFMAGHIFWWIALAILRKAQEK